jgi:hypothetical protein
LGAIGPIGFMPTPETDIQPIITTKEETEIASKILFLSDTMFVLVFFLLRNYIIKK